MCMLFMQLAAATLGHFQCGEVEPGRFLVAADPSREYFRRHTGALCRRCSCSRYCTQRDSAQAGWDFVGKLDAASADELSSHTIDRFNGRWSRGL